MKKALIVIAAVLVLAVGGYVFVVRSDGDLPGLQSLQGGPSAPDKDGSPPKPKGGKASKPGEAKAHANPKYGEPKSPAADKLPKESPAEAIQPEPTKEETWTKLSGKADKDGEVPVIVALQSSFTPEGELTEDGKNSQRKAISSKKGALLGELEGKKFKNLKTFDTLPIVALHADIGTLNALKNSKNVLNVSEDVAHRLPDHNELPTDATGDSIGSDVQGSSSNSALPDWWDWGRQEYRTAVDNGYDGYGQTVAILDTGVETSHWYFGTRTVRQACYASLPNTTNGSCPNGQKSQTGAGSAVPCTYSSGCAHGTHVAGTAVGAYGVAPWANLIAIQVFHWEWDPAISQWVPLSFTSDQISAMNYVYGLRGSYSIAAVNLSLGGGQFFSTCDSSNWGFYNAAANLRSVNIATVVASGNDNYSNALSSPSCMSNVVAVGNITKDVYNNDAVYCCDLVNGRYWGSNSSSMLDLLAEGTHICSSVPGGGINCNYTGTSMAAPHVAGALAALKQLEPWTTVTSSLSALQNSGTNISDYRNSVIKRRINLWSSLIWAYNN